MDRQRQPAAAHAFHGEYGVEGNYLVEYTDAARAAHTRLARRLEVMRIEKDVDTLDQSLRLRFIESSGKESEFAFLRDVALTRRGIPELLRKGVDIPEYLAREIHGYLRDAEQAAETVLVHHTLGFAPEGDRLVFRHHGVVGGAQPSTYAGPLKLSPAGTMDEQLAWLRELAVGFAPTELAIALGLSAPILGLLCGVVPMDSQLVHLYNESGLGKSTALRLLLSLFGSPDAVGGKGAGREGLMQTCNATANALPAYLRGNYGVPMGLDEAAMLPPDDLTPLIYRITGGAEKGRLNREITLRPTDRWCTTVVTTGEFPLTARTRKAGGIRARLIEIGHVVWTRSPEHADAIRAAVCRAHGHVGPAFARVLLDQPLTTVVTNWRKWQAWCLARMDGGQNASRLADRYAAILLAGDMAQAVLGAPLDVEGGIWPLLLEANLATADQRDLAQSAMDYLREVVARRSDKFPVGGPGAPGHEIWGRIDPQRDGTCSLYVFTSVFEHLLRDGGFEDADIIKHLWRERRWIDCEARKFTRKHAMVRGQRDVNVIDVAAWTAADGDGDAAVGGPAREIRRVQHARGEG